MVSFSTETDVLVSWNHPHDGLVSFDIQTGLFWQTKQSPKFQYQNRSLLTDVLVSCDHSYNCCSFLIPHRNKSRLVSLIYWSLWHWNPSLLTDGMTSVDHSDGVASCWSLLTPQQVSFERCAGLFRSFRRLPCCHALQHTQKHTATHWTCWSRSMLQASACRTRWRYQSLFMYTQVTLNRKISFFSYIYIYIQTQMCMFLWEYRSGFICRSFSTASITKWTFVSLYNEKKPIYRWWVSFHIYELFMSLLKKVILTRKTFFL